MNEELIEKITQMLKNDLYQESSDLETKNRAIVSLVDSVCADRDKTVAELKSEAEKIQESTEKLKALLQQRKGV